MYEEIRTPGLATIEHSFEVPLDHDDAAGPKITVFAREVGGAGLSGPGRRGAVVGGHVPLTTEI